MLYKVVFYLFSFNASNRGIRFTNTFFFIAQQSLGKLNAKLKKNYNQL